MRRLEFQQKREFNRFLRFSFQTFGRNIFITTDCLQGRCLTFLAQQRMSCTVGELSLRAPLQGGRAPVLQVYLKQRKYELDFHPARL